jgi:hypothetical protein
VTIYSDAATFVVRFFAELLLIAFSFFDRSTEGAPEGQSNFERTNTGVSRYAAHYLYLILLPYFQFVVVTWTVDRCFALTLLPSVQTSHLT